MSHPYAHKVFEVEEGKWYFAADNVRWSGDDIAEDQGDGGSYDLSPNPPYVGGPFADRATAADNMVGQRGNPGWIDVICYQDLIKIETWMHEKLTELAQRISLADGPSPS